MRKIAPTRVARHASAGAGGMKPNLQIANRTAHMSGRGGSELPFDSLHLLFLLWPRLSARRGKTHPGRWGRRERSGGV